MSAADVRSFLARHGLAAHRDRGQNFLVDPALAEQLVSLAGVAAGDSVIEIGTGLGILTRALAARAARVVTLEVDAGIVRALRADALLPPGVELLHADALVFDLAALADGLPSPVRVVANLPYSISAPLLRRLLDLRGQLADWSLMLQRDFVDRLLATPGSKHYGSLTVLHRLAVALERKRTLKPGCFHPVPKVASAFVRVTPHAAPVLRPGELECVERVARAAFSTRRKTLANALRGAGIAGPDGAALEVTLAQLGLDARVRAEAVSPEGFLDLSRALAPAPAAAEV
ncbi:MAG TPA: 16S rRNA (adenine(1518)-N(6)/adenine(1519)-N(6))-dimethyltransferase RsmA [Myxococcota bacterium]